MKKNNVIIIGAGGAGKELLDEIHKNKNLNLNVCGFLDDNKKLINKKYKNIKILGTISKLNYYIENKKITDIYICIPSAKGKTIRKIINICNKSKISFKIIPSTYELLTGKAKLEGLKELDLEDLLGRNINKSNPLKLKKFFQNKIILITGGAGSIGSELVKQVNRLKPKLIILYDWWENGIYDLQMEFNNNNIKGNIKYIIGDIKNKQKIKNIFKKYNPNIVYHAAAYKHVPLMEYNFSEAIENNIIGTKILAEISHKNGVENFVFISTDKAVKPSSIMGATKRIAEMIILNLNKKSKTIFSVVRFGNVFNSRGSVIPLFINQIKKGGPLTITDKNIVRFFMTIGEAVYLILQSSLLGKKEGELFILEMGKSIKIIDLAKSLIRFYGLIPDKDIKINFIGLRPGEKLKEELITNGENIEKTSINKLYKIKNKILNINKNLYKYIEDIKYHSNNDNLKEIEKIFSKIILDYKKY